MYQLVTAHYRRPPSIRWLEADLSQHPISKLSADYGDVWLYITWPSLDDPKAFRLVDVYDLIIDIEAHITVQEWLTSLGNMTLPLSTPPKRISKYVQYAQAWHSNYHFTPIARNGTVVDVGSQYHNPDLVIHHNAFEPSYIYHHAMFTVNGLFHKLDYNDEMVVIRDANKSVLTANDNQIGIYSFQSIGSIDYVSIEPDDVLPQQPGAPLWDGVYIRIPDHITDVENKTFLLVLGGYLHVLGRDYKRISDRLFQIDIRNYPLLDRYYDSRSYIDMSPMGLYEYENDGLVDIEHFKSDDVIRAYMSLEQTFFVVVDSPSFFQELVPLDPIGQPSTYLDYTNRHVPVVGAYGRMLEHHRIHEEGQYVISATTNWRRNFHYQTHTWDEGPAVDDGEIPNNPYSKAGAYLRLLGVEI